MEIEKKIRGHEQREVKKDQYNYNCQAQGFLGVALKTLCTRTSLHITTPIPPNYFLHFCN